MRYPATITTEGKRTLALFRFANGEECATFAEPSESIEAVAREALEGRLSCYFDDGDCPPLPPKRTPKGKVLWVDISPRLAVAIGLRWARQSLRLSQDQLAKRVGVSQQQIAQLERPGANPTLQTLEKVARALGAHLSVGLEFGARA